VRQAQDLGVLLLDVLMQVVDLIVPAAQLLVGAAKSLLRYRELGLLEEGLVRGDRHVDAGPDAPLEDVGLEDLEVRRLPSEAHGEGLGVALVRQQLIMARHLSSCKDESSVSS
jgi:hypothetical protein